MKTLLKLICAILGVLATQFGVASVPGHHKTEQNSPIDAKRLTESLANQMAQGIIASPSGLVVDIKPALNHEKEDLYAQNFAGSFAKLTEEELGKDEKAGNNINNPGQDVLANSLIEIDTVRNSDTEIAHSLDKIFLKNLKDDLIKYYNAYSHSAEIEESYEDGDCFELYSGILSYIEYIQSDKRNSILDEEKNTLLILAAKYNCFGAIPYLIENCAFNNFDARNNYGRTAFDYAKLHQNRNMIGYINEHRLKYQSQLNINSQPCLVATKTKKQKSNDQRLASITSHDKQETERLRKIQEQVQLKREQNKQEEQNQLLKQARLKYMENQAVEFNDKKMKPLLSKYMKEWMSRYEDVLGLNIDLERYNCLRSKQQTKNVFQIWQKAQTVHKNERELDEKACMYHAVSHAQKQVCVKRDVIQQLKKHATISGKNRAMEKKADQFARGKVFKKMHSQILHNKQVRAKEEESRRIDALLTQRIIDQKRKQEVVFNPIVHEKLALMDLLKQSVDHYKKRCALKNQQEDLKVIQELESLASSLTQQTSKSRLSMIELYNDVSRGILYKAEIDIQINELQKLRHVPAIYNAAQANTMKHLHTDHYWHARYIGDVAAIDAKKAVNIELAAHNNDAQLWWNMHQNNNKGCVACANYADMKNNPKAEAQMSRRKSF